ncbi:hypothetical protein Pelo_16373 [Pelomyxa schiedti]|nr:hypothetical protein Pelo_16373 [Pelomyxa schiedti]
MDRMRERLQEMELHASFITEHVNQLETALQPDLDFSLADAEAEAEAQFEDGEAVEGEGYDPYYEVANQEFVFDDAEGWAQMGATDTPAFDEEKEQRRLTKRQQRKSAWLRREFEARWLVEKSVEDFAEEFMGDICGLPTRSRAPRLREWLFEEGMGGSKKGPVCAWVPEIEQAVLSWLLSKGGIIAEPDWDDKEDTVIQQPSLGIWAPVCPKEHEVQHVGEAKPENNAMAEALRDTTATLVQRNKEIQQLNKEIQQLQSQLSVALSSAVEKQQSTEDSQKAQQTSVTLRSIVASWTGGVDEVADAVMSEIGNSSFPPRSRHARFRNWVQTGSCFGWEVQIEDAVKHWAEGVGIDFEEITSQRCCAAAETPLHTIIFKNPQQDSIAALEAENIALKKRIAELELERIHPIDNAKKVVQEGQLEVGKAIGVHEVNELTVESLLGQVKDLQQQLCQSQEENKELAKQLEERNSVDEIKAQKELEQAHDLHSTVLREIVNNEWLTKHTLEEFVAEHMSGATGIPQRSKVARFRQWMQGGCSGCEEVIELCVEQWLKSEGMEIEVTGQNKEVTVNVVCVPVTQGNEIVKTHPIVHESHSAPSDVVQTQEMEEIQEELSTLRGIIAKNEDKKQKRRKATHSAKLRQLVRDTWLPKFSQEEFADEIMVCVPAIPERSRRARLREWLEGKPSIWENEIEATVQTFLEVKGLYNSEEEGETVPLPPVHPVMTCQPVNKYEQEDLKEQCQLLSTANKELSSHLSYLEGDQKSLQQDLEDIKFRYFQSLVLSFKLQGMHLSHLIGELYETAQSQCFDYTQYESFLCSLLAS